MDVPPEAEKLLAATPEDFVEERNRVARELKDAGRADEAAAVSALRKPSAVVLAVNRAARDRSQSAHDAADAAGRLASAQLSADTEAFRLASQELADALDALAEVAVARLSRGKPANEGMKRRVADLLRSAVADDGTRQALARGALVEEGGASGFDAFAGLSVPARKGSGTAKRRAPTRDTVADERRERERALQDELAAAEGALDAAERGLRKAQRERDAAAKSVDSVEKKLERLRKR